jgi:hypothetical protein
MSNADGIGDQFFFRNLEFERYDLSHQLIVQKVHLKSYPGGNCLLKSLMRY